MGIYILGLVGEGNESSTSATNRFWCAEVNVWILVVEDEGEKESKAKGSQEY